ncbi:hypothetical protein HW555_000375 [Spodoptera exigua]|uniref:Uncharacterized protein n=1 Tax=Spodoptera exigua TaxID=7107 RepID=A0A835GWB7_SPOEX|nr:hypothetical protein HW555_000375 [Spodoptera exigua]
MTKKKNSKLTHAECLERKRMAERKRKEKIRNDPVKLEELRRKERERYHKKKAEGKILPLSEMPPRARRVQQKRNRVNFKAYYERKKRALLENTKQANQICETINDERISPSILPRSESPIPTTSQIQSFNQQMHQKSSRILRSQKRLQEETSDDIPIECISETNSVKDRSRREPLSLALWIEQSSTPAYPPCSPPIAPNVSSIHSPVSTFALNSPKSDVSTNSFVLRRELNYKLRQYQRRKSAEIMKLRETIIKIKREKEMYRKRLNRLQQITKISPKHKNKLTPGFIKKKISPEKRKIHNLVKSFYEDDENSKQCPGKQDYITRHKLKKQKRYLTDSLKNLHRKYLDSGLPPIRNETKAQSFCTASTSLRHDASSVWAHLIPILREVKEILSEVCTIHFVSDSPSAQYRNKKVFYLISQLKNYFPNLTCVVWHYCECGHGKGAPDGVGGVLKRSADRLVAFGKDVTDIDSLVQTLKTVVTGVKIEIVQEHEVIEKDELLPKNLKPFPGSMKVHQIVWTKTSTNGLAMRSLSCVEPGCLYDTIRCCHGKHMGFYELPTEANVQEEVEIKRDVVLLKSSGQSSSITNACSDVQPPQIYRFPASKPFILKRPNQIQLTGPSHDLISMADYDQIQTPNVSFFDNINSEVLSQYECTEEDKTTYKNDKNDYEDDESDDDLNIF